MIGYIEPSKDIYNEKQLENLEDFSITRGVAQETWGTLSFSLGSGLAHWDVNHIIHIGSLKQNNSFNVICDRKAPLKFKRKIHCTNIKFWGRDKTFFLMANISMLIIMLVFFSLPELEPWTF